MKLQKTMQLVILQLLPTYYIGTKAPMVNNGVY